MEIDGPELPPSGFSNVREETIIRQAFNQYLSLVGRALQRYLGNATIPGKDKFTACPGQFVKYHFRAGQGRRHPRVTVG